MTDYSELVKRIQHARKLYEDAGVQGSEGARIMFESLEAIEAQAAEIERLELEVEGANAIIAQERSEVMKLRREIERLRAYQDELENIADAFGCECGDQARAALKGGE